MSSSWAPEFKDIKPYYHWFNTDNRVISDKEKAVRYKMLLLFNKYNPVTRLKTQETNEFIEMVIDGYLSGHFNTNESDDILRDSSPKAIETLIKGFEDELKHRVKRAKDHWQWVKRNVSPEKRSEFEQKMIRDYAP